MAERHRGRSLQDTQSPFRRSSRNISEAGGRENVNGPSGLPVFRGQPRLKPRPNCFPCKDFQAVPLADFAFQRCISPRCGYTCGAEEVRVACPQCGDLLDVAYDWDKARPPTSLRYFEQM